MNVNRVTETQSQRHTRRKIRNFQLKEKTSSSPVRVNKNLDEATCFKIYYIIYTSVTERRAIGYVQLLISKSLRNNCSRADRWIFILASSCSKTKDVIMQIVHTHVWESTIFWNLRCANTSILILSYILEHHASLVNECKQVSKKILPTCSKSNRIFFICKHVSKTSKDYFSSQQIEPHK